MGIMISNCGCNEFGKATGGKAGDQTGGEWRIREWYDRPWDCVLRYPDKKVQEMIASLARSAAENDMIGYDQETRYGFWEQLKKYGYDPARINTPCNADCSSGVAAILKAAGYRLGIDVLKQVSIYCYTGNLKVELAASGFTVLAGKAYTKGTEYLLPGDILLNEAHHTCIVLGPGKGSDGKVGICQVELKTFLIGAKDNQVKTIQRLLNAIGYTDQNGNRLEVDGELGEKTSYAITRFQKDHGMKGINYGTVAGMTWKALLSEE